ncbi:hypothetical protein [Streptomyces globisporus]
MIRAGGRSRTGTFPDLRAVHHDIGHAPSRRVELPRRSGIDVLVPLRWLVNDDYNPAAEEAPE